jgi:hypothetical protein
MRVKIKTKQKKLEGNKKFLIGRLNWKKITLTKEKKKNEDQIRKNNIS